MMKLNMPPKSLLANKPLLLILMGVSGSGKSTLAKRLADYYQGEFIEADEFHSIEAKKQMAAGIPLTNAQREPWVQSICDYLCALKLKNSSNKQQFITVLSYSGLVKSQRDQFRTLGFDCHYIFLNVDKAVIMQRLQHRQHFFNPSLIDSQFQSLEMPQANEKNIHQLTIHHANHSIDEQFTELQLITHSLIN